MRTLLRYLLWTSLVVGVAYGLFVHRFNGRTAFGHLRASSASTFEEVIAKIRSDIGESFGEKKPPPKKIAVKKPAPAPQAAPALPAAPPPKLTPKEQERRVERLKKAAATVSAAPKKGAPTKRTRVDERIPARSEKAVDALLTSRVNALAKGR